MLEQKVVITGAAGQLGRELVRTAPPTVQCRPLQRDQLDIGDAKAVRQCLGREQADLLINAAAYTAVDRAESEPQAARRINAEGAGHLAVACRESGTRLIHVSTDFLFDGESSHPYEPCSPTSPLGEYGRSKLEGELAVQRELPGSLIVRTGWVYSAFGANFVKTMLRLMAEREELGVVVDQVGTPTWANGLARALWAASAREQLSGIYHWSDAGACSWYDFAVAICEEACAQGLLARPVTIRPIPASDYPTPAQRPAFSVLDKRSAWRDFELDAVHWRHQLRAMLGDLKELEHV